MRCKIGKKNFRNAGCEISNVNFGAAKLMVEHNIADSLIMQAVKQSGYKAERSIRLIRQPGQIHLVEKCPYSDNHCLRRLLAIAAILDWTGIANTFVIPLYALAAVIGGFHSAKSGFYSLRSLSLDMNFLMTVAIIGAAAIGEWSEGAAVAFLFSFGNTLQAYTLDKTRQSIRSLMELAPPEALVRRGTEEIRLPVEEIVVGDIVIIKPGERIAMDGIVLSGISAVNQATITGESIPVEKTTGDMVYAGTMNEHGAFGNRGNQDCRQFNSSQNLTSCGRSPRAKSTLAAVCRCVCKVLYPSGPCGGSWGYGSTLVAFSAAFCPVVL